MPPTPGKFDKFKAKFESAVAENNTYEALQILRTVRNRCRDASQALECLTLLFTATVHFASINEKTTVLDLADVYADTLMSFSIPASAEIYNNIKVIFGFLPSSISQVNVDSKDEKNTDVRTAFLNKIFDWSKTVSSRSFRKIRGDPALHNIFAHVYWKQGEFNTARLHFLLANNPEAFADFLIEYTLHHDTSDVDEADNYASQAVLQLLAYRKLRIAQAFLPYFVAKHPSLSSNFPFKGSPILNLIWLLLIAVQHRNLHWFFHLATKYKNVIDGDCNYRGSLDKVAQLFFNAPPPSRQQHGLSGIFGNLFQGLMPPKDSAARSDNYSADEELETESAKAIALKSWPSAVSDATFRTMDDAADAVTPPGILIDTDTYEDAVETHEESEHEQELPVAAPSVGVNNDDMDLD